MVGRNIHIERTSSADDDSPVDFFPHSYYIEKEETKLLVPYLVMIKNTLKREL
jgi:hypothetical protein